MRPRWNKVISDLFSHPVRSLLVIASIAVGLFAVGMIATIHGILKSDMIASYALVQPANIQVRSDPFQQEFIDRISHVPGVRDAAGAFVMDIRVLTAPEVWTAINVKADHTFSDQSLNLLALQQGRWPETEQEIAIEINNLPDLHANLGDMIDLKLASSTVRQFRIVGIVHDQTIGSASGGGGFFLAPIQGYVLTKALPWLEQTESYNTLYVTVTDHPNDLEAIRQLSDQIATEFDHNGLTAYNSVIRRSTDHPNIVYLDAMASILFVLGVLVVFLSGFLITNTLSALLNQQITQIGVMKTVGANTFQVAGVYMALILVFSLIALALAIPTSFYISYQLLEFLSTRINFILQPHRMVPAAVYEQIFIALLVPQAAGFLPILQGTRITIQAALSGVTGGSVDDSGRFYRFLLRIRRASRPLLISLRNTFRQRTRLMLTLFTLTLGGAIFIGTFNVRASIDSHIARLRRYFIADVNLTFDRPYRIDQVQRDLAGVPGVVSVEGWATARAELVKADRTSGESIQLLGTLPESKLIQPMILSGRWIMPGDQNAITLSELFKDRFPNLKVGDTIQLKVNGKITDWVVVGFFQFAGKATGLFAYTSYDYLSVFVHAPGKSSVFRVVAGDGLHSLEAQEHLGLQLETYLNERGYHIADVRAGLSLQSSATKGLNILTTFLMIMALMMAMVGSIGLMGTMSLNVMERTREIGVMRAVGASDRAISWMVIVEGMLIGVLSWLLGCLVAIPISKVMSDVISAVIFSSSAELTFTLSGVSIWLGLVLLLSILASVVPAHNASRLTIREVLSYE